MNWINPSPIKLFTSHIKRVNVWGKSSKGVTVLNGSWASERNHRLAFASASSFSTLSISVSLATVTSCILFHSISYTNNLFHPRLPTKTIAFSSYSALATSHLVSRFFTGNSKSSSTLIRKLFNGQCESKSRWNRPFKIETKLVNFIYQKGKTRKKQVNLKFPAIRFPYYLSNQHKNTLHDMAHHRAEELGICRCNKLHFHC